MFSRQLTCHHSSIYGIMIVENMNLNQEQELKEAQERIEKEKQDPDFYSHYTDDRIKELDNAIE